MMRMIAQPESRDGHKAVLDLRGLDGFHVQVAFPEKYVYDPDPQNHFEAFGGEMGHGNHVEGFKVKEPPEWADSAIHIGGDMNENRIEFVGANPEGYFTVTLHRERKVAEGRYDVRCIGDGEVRAEVPFAVGTMYRTNINADALAVWGENAQE